MKWHPRKPGAWAQVTQDARYSVCAIAYQKSDGTPRHFYEAWRTRSHADGPHLIATNLASAEHARELCEEDDRDA